MEDKEEVQRQARQQARIIEERIQAENAIELGDQIAGAQALEWLRVSLEGPLAHDLKVFVDDVRDPELGVLVRDRADKSQIMVVTRAGKVLHATLAGEKRPWNVTHVKEDMRNDVIAYLTKRKLARLD